MAQGSRRRPAGGPAGREPGRSARARQARAARGQRTPGRGQAPRTAASAGGRTGPQRTSDASARATRRTAGAPGPSGKSGTGRSNRQSGGNGGAQRQASVAGVGQAIAARCTAAWEVVTGRREGAEGVSPRRVVIVIVMLCFLSLSLAGPVHTYFTQRSDAAHAAERHEELTRKVAKLERKKDRLADPDYIRRQARDRLGFVEEGRTPYIVELPGDPHEAEAQHEQHRKESQPWYSSVWDSISQEAPDDPSGADSDGVRNVIPAPAQDPGVGDDGH